MDDIISIVIAVLTLVIGGCIGYYMRQRLAKKRAGSLEARLQKRVIDVKQETGDMVKNAEKKSAEILDKTQKEVDERIFKSSASFADKRNFADRKDDFF